jgi:hypothetical protein
MDPLHALIALGPLAIYFLVLGWINLAPRPTVVNGMSDTAALGVALAGLMMAGPLELFLPEAAANVFGWMIWPLLLAFYFLCVTLYVLLMRPRLVIYNVTGEQLRSVMAEVIAQLDPDARHAGECVNLPNLGVQLHWEALPAFRNIQLQSAGGEQHQGGWRELEKALRERLRNLRGSPNPYGFSLVGGAVLMFSCMLWWLISRPAEIQELSRDMFRLVR